MRGKKADFSIHTYVTNSTNQVPASVTFSQASNYRCWYFGLNTLPDPQHDLTVLVSWDHLLTSRCTGDCAEEDSKLFSGPVCEIYWGEVQSDLKQCNLSVADLQSPSCLKPHYNDQQRNCIRHEEQPQGLSEDYKFKVQRLLDWISASRSIGPD